MDRPWLLVVVSLFAVVQPLLATEKADTLIREFQALRQQRRMLTAQKSYDERESKSLADQETKALASLRKLGDSALDSIERELSAADCDPGLRWELMGVLGRGARSEAAAAVAVKYVRDPQLSLAALRALKAIGPPAKGAVDEIAKLVRTTQDSSDRKAQATEGNRKRKKWGYNEMDWAALEALEAIGHGTPFAVSVLEARIAAGMESRSEVPLASLGALGMESLLKLAALHQSHQDDPYWQPYYDASFVCQNHVHSREAISVLAAHVRRGGETADVATNALAYTGAPAKDVLFDLLSSMDPKVRHRAARGLNRMLRDVETARTFRMEKVADPFSRDDFFQKLKKLAANENGLPDPEILAEIEYLDREKAAADEEITKLIGRMRQLNGPKGSS